MTISARTWSCSALAAVVTACLLVGAGAPARAADGGLSVGTFNIDAAQKVKVWKRAVTKFRRDVQVAGLQEVSSDTKRSFLRRSRGWDSYAPQAPKVQQNPVIWRTGVFDRVSARAARIAKGRHVGHEKAGMPAYRPASWATVVRLRDRTTGGLLSVVNVHLVAGGVNGGKAIRSNRKLYRLYLDQVQGLARVVRTERGWADARVVVTGDFNDNYVADRTHRHAKLVYRQLVKAGYVSAWESRKELKPRHGSTTAGGSYLDNVWATTGARSITVNRTINVSQHFPVVARYPAL